MNSSPFPNALLALEILLLIPTSMLAESERVLPRWVKFSTAYICQHSREHQAEQCRGKDTTLLDTAGDWEDGSLNQELGLACPH